MGLVTVGAGAGLGWVNVQAYGAAGNGSHDDTTAIQAAIDATPEGGTVYLPAGTYKITAEIVIDKALTFRGAGCHEINGSAVTDDVETCNWPLGDPPLLGAVIVPSTAGQNGVKITATGRAVNLHGFGVLFDEAIRFLDTGHGIYALPDAVSGGFDNGLMGFEWSNLTVCGHDGDHYGFSVTNPLQLTWDGLHAYGGGAFQLLNHSSSAVIDGAPINYGNAHLTNCYGVLALAGSANGLHTQSISGFMNLILLTRTQVWTRSTVPGLPEGTSPVASPQLNFTFGENVNRVSILQTDFEDGAGCSGVWPTGGCFIDPAGAVSGAIPAFVMIQPAAHNFGDRSTSRSMSWNFDFVSGDATGSAEFWGWRKTDGTPLLGVEVGPARGGMYVGKGATGSRPASPVSGEMFLDTTLKKLVIYDGSAWKDAVGGTP